MIVYVVLRTVLVDVAARDVEALPVVEGVFSDEAAAMKYVSDNAWHEDPDGPIRWSMVEKTLQ